MRRDCERRDTICKSDRSFVENSMAAALAIIEADYIAKSVAIFAVCEANLLTCSGAISTENVHYNVATPACGPVLVAKITHHPQTQKDQAPCVAA